MEVPQEGKYVCKLKDQMVIYEASTGSLCGAMPCVMVETGFTFKHTLVLVKADGTIQTKTTDTLKAVFGWDGVDPFWLMDNSGDGGAMRSVEFEIVGGPETGDKGGVYFNRRQGRVPSLQGRPDGLPRRPRALVCAPARNAACDPCARPVTHGDLKSKGNLLVAEAEKPCVLDFCTAFVHRPGFHPVNNWLFEHGRRMDLNAYVKHKYHGRYQDIAGADLEWLDYSRIEYWVRRLSGRPVDQFPRR